MLTCGLVRSNLAFATALVLLDCVLLAAPPWWGGPGGARRCGSCRVSEDREGRHEASESPVAVRDVVRDPGSHPGHGRASLAGRLRDDLLGHVGRDLRVALELHRVVRPALGPRPQVA